MSKAFKFTQDILHSFAELGPFLNQFVATAAARGVNPAGDGKDLPVELGGHAGGNERAAYQIRLHHDGPKCHAGHDAVSYREGLAVARAVHGELGDESPGFCYFFEEPCIAHRV